MGCFPGKEEVMCALASYKNLSQPNSTTDSIIPLKKGGVLVKTSLGFVQYGIPPETLKDSMELGWQVPEYFLIPDRKISSDDGINLMEFEFPVYYNFFLKNGTKTKLICDGATARAIRTIFQETLLGPADLASFSEDFASGYQGIPDMRRELDYFAQNVSIPGEKYEFSKFIDLVELEDGKTATLERLVEGKPVKVLISKIDGDFVFTEGRREVARLTEEVKLCQSNFFVWTTLSNEEFALFDPPVFGVTLLGNSHGFDICGSTTGFIIWINKKGVMVDPPPYSSSALREQGIPPNFIQKVIITHCHADHDSGAFHKIVESSPVELISTRTIVGSFLRKYSALADLTPKEVQRLFQYRFVEIGHPTLILGARFTFGYAFHSVPTINFEVEFEGKKFFFSGDTCYHPERLLELRDQGVLNQARYEFLTQRDWSKYDLILHEAGVPPIHTPIQVLASLPASVREKMRLIHVAKKDILPEHGLIVGCVGLKNTIILADTTTDQQASVFNNINLLSDVELINWVPFSRIYETIKCFSECRFEEGETIVEEGAYGNQFFVIKSGIVRLSSNSAGNSFSKLCCRGDFFGESAVTGSGTRLATVVAMTPVEALAIDGADFRWVFSFQSEGFRRSKNPVEMIHNLYEIRRQKQAEFINLNTTLCKLTENQKGLINMSIKEEFVKRGTTLWEHGQQPDFCFFIKSGKFQIKIPFQKIDRNAGVRTGSLLGDFPSLLRGLPADSSVKCLEDGVVFKFNRSDLQSYLTQYPGFALVLKDKYVVV